MTWNQNYDPLGWWPLSTLVSALPVFTLFFVLLVLRKRVWVSALCGMVMAVVLAAAVFHMPAPLIAAAGVNGFVFGFFRIAWIIIASIYLYNVAVETGQFQVMKESIAGLSSDRRLQVILIAFCFGAFLEGTGGGGAPVAIAGSFLIGLGFPHFQAATLCLLANTAPVAWGGVGNPIRVLNGVTGLPVHELNAMVGRILPPFSFILPAWLVITMVGWRKALEVLPALLVSGASFAAMQFYWSNYQETGLVDIVAAIFSLLVMVAFLRFWKPRQLMEEGEGERTDRAARARPRGRAQGLVALRPGLGPHLPVGAARLQPVPEDPRPHVPDALAPQRRHPNGARRPGPDARGGLDRPQLLRPAGDGGLPGRLPGGPAPGDGRGARPAAARARPSASSCRRCWPSASWSASPTSRSTRGWTP